MSSAIKIDELLLKYDMSAEEESALAADDPSTRFIYTPTPVTQSEKAAHRKSQSSKKRSRSDAAAVLERRINGITYRSIVGAFQYIANATRPDIVFMTNHLAGFSSNPQPQHFAGAMKLLVYLKRTKDLN